MIKEDIRYKDACIFEGMTSISAVLNSTATDRKIKRVLYDKSCENKLSRKLSFLSHRAAEQGFEIVCTDSGELDSLTVGSSHGGIIAECSGRTIPEISADEIDGGGFYVYVEGIEDPYNFGYALRSLYAAGVNGVVLPERNWMSAAGVVCRSSAGASELMRLFTGGDDMCETFKKRGYKVLCADTENSVSIYETECKKPVLLVIGGEKRGISRKMLSQADKIVRIDYGRDYNASLSAASASAVLAFEIMRQNR